MFPDINGLLRYPMRDASLVDTGAEVRFVKLRLSNSNIAIGIFLFHGIFVRFQEGHSVSVQLFPHVDISWPVVILDPDSAIVL